MGETITTQKTHAELQTYLTVEHTILTASQFKKSFDYIEELINRNVIRIPKSHYILLTELNKFLPKKNSMIWLRCCVLWFYFRKQVMAYQALTTISWLPSFYKYQKIIFDKARFNAFWCSFLFVLIELRLWQGFSIAKTAEDWLVWIGWCGRAADGCQIKSLANK